MHDSLRSWPSGHDVEPLVREGLAGANDDAVYNACRREERTLVTLDLDFSNPLRFPPGVTEGIVVVRPPRNVLPMIRSTLASALPDLRSRSLKGRLWIVEPGRIRVYDPQEEP